MLGWLDKFWFTSIDARQYAALRIAFGALSAFYFVQLLPYVSTEFSATGWLGDIRQIASQNGGSWSLFFLQNGPYADALAYLTVIVGIVAAVLLSIGWRSRLSAAITWLVWVSLWNRNPLLLDGDDAILKVMCFYLMLAPSGNCWSVDAYIHKMPSNAVVWPLRLIQFQIALIYFVSGWVKFYSPEWLDGSILQVILIHPEYSRWNGWAILDKSGVKRWLSNLADLIRWWELLFPVLLINRYSRNICLVIGVLFHVGLMLTMNLRLFPVIMLSLYPALLSNRSFLHLERKLVIVCRLVQ